MLRQVQLPMARRTIVVGVNQSMMAALSMATIAALVNGPGLGKAVNAALQIQNIGAAFVAGILIVLIGDHARPHHDGGQRAVREHGPSGVASVSGPGVMLAGSSSVAALGRREAGVSATTVARPTLAGPRFPDPVLVYFSRQQLSAFPTRDDWPS